MELVNKGGGGFVRTQDLGNGVYSGYREDQTFRSATEALRWLTSKDSRVTLTYGLFFPRTQKPGDVYWFNQRYCTHFRPEDVEYMGRVHARYLRFRHYVEEIEPEWRKVNEVHYADNSVEEIQQDKYGNRRTRLTTAPSGDRCF